MKSYLLLFLIAISFNQNIFAQESELDSLITESKVKMKAFGYKLIGEGSLNSNIDNQLVFNQKSSTGQLHTK